MLSGVPNNAKIATEPLRFVPSGTSLSRMSPHTHSHRPHRVRMNLACGSVGWRLVVALRRGMAGEHHPRVCAVNAERQSERRTVNGKKKVKTNRRSQSAVHSRRSQSAVHPASPWNLAGAAGCGEGGLGAWSLPWLERFHVPIYSPT